MGESTKYLIQVLCVALFALTPCFGGAQGSLPQRRITSSIDEAQLSPLKGGLHPLARPQNDRGAADPSLMIQRITMAFQPTAAQQADLDALLAAQQNPTSASFHQWLTPQQYGERFGIAPADLAKVTSWLQFMGFTVVESPASRTLIVFNGTAGQVRAAFHADIHNYEAKGQKFYANSSEPSVPAALAGIVSGFRGLNSVRMQPRAVPNKQADSKLQPNFTASGLGNHYIAPGDFATIYDLNPLYSASPAIDGTGQKIVVVGQSQVTLGDIATFRSLSGLSPNVPQTILVPSSANPGPVDGDIQESSLDIEWAGAVARNATILFVYSGNGVLDALQYAVSQNLAPIISISYGSCEAVNPPDEMRFLAYVAQQANAQGITIVSSVGDSGATDCDGSISPANYPAKLGLSVDFPSSLPYVTGVGGTEFNEGNGSYWQPAPDTDVISSALSYIPEIVWNDSSSQNGLDATGGGASSVYGKPTWQTGTGVPADGARDVPDISLAASNTHDPYLVCSWLSGTTTSSCQNGFRNSATDVNFNAYGGTSFGAPTFAGILALINQQTGSTGQGNINYILYPLAVIASSVFHDIATGNNNSPCVFQSLGCLDGNPIGFQAGLGYDQATGLGTINATNLVNSWSSVSSGAGGSTPVLSTISPTSIAAGSADFTLTATGSNFATNAQILWNGSTAGVTMLPGGTSTTIQATISHTLVAYGTSTAGTVGAVAPFTSTFVAVTDDAAKAGESTVELPFTVNGVPPANDNIANATGITSSNYSGTVDNSAATTEATDPRPQCAVTGPNASTNPTTKTVWWTLAATGTATVTVSTIGSSYDTTLSVWTGTPGSLTNVACNDDVSTGQYTSALLTFPTTTGTTYYIMVAAFGPPDGAVDQAGGKTVLNVTNAKLAPAPPAITSPNSATYTLGVAGNFTFTATGSPAPTFTKSGLIPGGLSLNPVTGQLSGIPGFGSQGVFPIVVTATNGSGPPATQNFTLTANLAPTITSDASVTFTVGTEGFFQFFPSGFPFPTLTESGALPPGVTLDSDNYVLIGTPLPGSGGVYHITFTAHNGVGQDAIQHFTLTVDEAPAVTSAASATFVVGVLGTFHVTASGTPAPAFTETGPLPTGVVFNNQTGVLSGTPAAGSLPSYPITFTAQNGISPNAMQQFTLNIAVPALSATPSSQTVAAGSSATYQIANSGSSTYTLSCSGLPAGASCPSVSVAPNASASLVIATTSRVAGIPPSVGRRPINMHPWPGIWVVLLISLAVFVATRKRGRFALVPLGSLALLLVCVAAGCGLSGPSGPGGPSINSNGTPAGTYRITVTGTSSGAPAEPIAITLIVT
jgi:Pro-kumamolisin, activation domain/Putative Ig domain